MEVQTERFAEKYDAITLPQFLPPGAIAGGKNMRKISVVGGWKPRKGDYLLNTTPTTDELLSIHSFFGRIAGDYHLITQTSGVLKTSTVTLEDLITQGGEVITTQTGDHLAAATEAEPFEQATSLGNNLVTDASPERSGFSDTVGDDWIYADGSGAPVIFGGQSPPCDAFLITSSGNLIEYSKEVRDSSALTFATVVAGELVYYVASKERAQGLILNFGSNVNTNNVSITIATRRGGAWVNVSSLTDGTSGTYTHDTDGQIDWSESSSDELYIIANKMAFWYRITFSGAATTIDITKCRVIRNASRMSNKWDGVFRYPTGAAFYDASEGRYVDRLGAITSVAEDEYMDLDAATTSDFIYAKLPEAAAIFGFAVPKGQENGANAQLDGVEYYGSGGWTSLSFTDRTLDDGADSSFGQTGVLTIDERHTPVKLSLPGAGDDLPGYWYRFSWDAALGAGTRVYTIVYGAQPDDFVEIRGAVNFRGRAFYWGHPDYPNRLIFSPYERPDEICRIEEHVSQPCGAGGTIKACGVLAQVLIVVTDLGTFLSKDGIVFETAADVGISSAATFAVAKFGDQTMNKEQVQSVALWQNADGVYKFDKTGLAKISTPIDQYFNPQYPTVLASDEVEKLVATIDANNNEYHLVLPSVELVYSLAGDEWYPAWERQLPLRSIACLKDQYDQQRLVGGTWGGFLLLLDEHDNDRNSSNVEVAIEHSVLSRIIANDPPAIETTLRKLWAEFMTQSSGEVETKLYTNFVSTGVVQNTPEAISLVEADYDYVIRRLDLSNLVHAFQLEFICNTLDVEMWITWFAYQLEIHGTHHI